MVIIGEQGRGAAEKVRIAFISDASKRKNDEWAKLEKVLGQVRFGDINQFRTRKIARICVTQENH